MTKVTTRKLKDSLSDYLRRAQNGEQIIVMRGSRAVAAIVSLTEIPGADETSRLQRLAARGLVVLPEDSTPTEELGNHRVPHRGRSAATMVLEDRR